MKRWTWLLALLTLSILFAGVFVTACGDDDDDDDDNDDSGDDDDSNTGGSACASACTKYEDCVPYAFNLLYDSQAQCVQDCQEHLAQGDDDCGLSCDISLDCTAWAQCLEDCYANE